MREFFRGGAYGAAIVGFINLAFHTPQMALIFFGLGFVLAGLWWVCEVRS